MRDSILTGTIMSLSHMVFPSWSSHTVSATPVLLSVSTYLNPSVILTIHDARHLLSSEPPSAHWYRMSLSVLRRSSPSSS